MALGILAYAGVCLDPVWQGAYLRSHASVLAVPSPIGWGDHQGIVSSS